MKSYRRIEITAFRRRVTIMSGEPLRDFPGEQAPRADEGLRLDDAEDDGMGLRDVDSGESIEVESAEGQLLIAEAVCLLQQRLSADARAEASIAPDTFKKRRLRPRQTKFYLKLQSLTRAVKWQRFFQKEK